MTKSTNRRKRNVPLNIKCTLCGEVTTLMVAEADIDEYLFSDNRRHVQDIFPYLSAEERELLISYTCPKCWKEMFSAFEE